MTTNIDTLVSQFTTDLEAHIAGRINKQLVEAVAAAMVPRAIGARKQRRKGPIQLCPVPRCKERAAPAFSMLCARHKGTPKKLVAKYRAARRRSKKRTAR